MGIESLKEHSATEDRLFLRLIAAFFVGQENAQGYNLAPWKMQVTKIGSKEDHLLSACVYLLIASPLHLVTPVPC